MEVKTVGVIGGGLSGLCAALALARMGFDVSLFEANDKTGGCCATTVVDGYVFNDGAMYVALPQIMDHAFERLGLNRAALLPLKRIDSVLTTHLDSGDVITLNSGLRLQHHSPDARPVSERDREQLRQLLAKWQPFMALLTDELVRQPFSLFHFLRKAWRQLPKLRGSVADQLQREIGDPSLRSALAGVMLYTGLPPEQTPAAQMIGLAAMLDDQCYLPVGGMGRIVQVLEAQLRMTGARICLNARVEKIEMANGRAAQLSIAGQAPFVCDAVISTTSAMHTLQSLLDPAWVPARLRRRLSRLPLSQRALSVQLGLRNRIEAASHFMNRLPAMEQQRALLTSQPDVPRWLSYTVPTVTMPELAPPGGSIIELYPSIDATLPARDWTPAMAQAAACGAIERLQRIHAMDIAATRVRSPAWFEQSLHLYEGAIYGLSPAADARSQFSHASGIPGLLLAGQTCYPGYGVGPAMMSGLFAAQAVYDGGGR